jgi:hypothetical protein
MGNVKNIGLGSPEAPHRSSKGLKAPKLDLKWATTGYILTYPLKSKWFKPQMAWNR